MDTRQYPVAPGRDEDQERAMPDLKRSRLERAPRLVLPASAAMWTAGEILHLTGGHALEAGVAGVVASAVAYGASGRGRIPGWVTGAVAGTSCWLCAAAQFGPLHWWPEAPLTWGAAVAALAVNRWARRHPAVTAAQQHREARAEWLASTSRRWHLGGSHLLNREDTRLGEVYDIDTTGTGKLASQLPLRTLPEQIAQERNLPTARRVNVSIPRPGRVRISVRNKNPWEHPVRHPLLDPDPEIDLTGPYSIRDPAAVGIDPETGDPLEIPLVDSNGAKNISIVAVLGSGKTVLLNDVSERVTAADDAILVRINVSIKGPGERHVWGPACHLTAFGPKEKQRAVRVVRALHGIMMWRSERYATTSYVPTPADPAVVVLLDEVSALASSPAIRKLVEDLATTGREYGIVLVTAGQRGTADFTSAKIRSQVNVTVMGRVARAGEAYHAGDAAMQMPDMSAYGEGAEGVWGIAKLASPPSMGRSFLLTAAESAELARERAFTQPGLPAACAEALGDDYADLLATEVFADWAREQQAAGNPVPVPGRAPAGGTMTQPLPVMTADPADEKAAFRRWEDEMEADMDDDTRETIERLSRSAGEKIAQARDTLAQTASRPKPDSTPDPDAMADFVRQRWEQVANAVQIPDEAREEFLGLLARGTTISEVAKTFEITNWTARTWLERMGLEKVAEVRGKGRGSRWHLIEEAQDGDGS